MTEEMEKPVLLSATQEQLQKRFKSYQSLIRACVLAEKEWLKNHTVEQRTLTGVWYDFAKIVLGRYAGKEAHEPKWARYRRQDLSRIISQMVLAGEVDYDDLSVENTDRKVDICKAGLWDKYILFCEKDEAYDHCVSVAKLYKVHACSGKGQNATAAMVKLFNGLDKENTYRVYVLTDYDRYGFAIANSFKQRAKRLGLKCDFARIGLNPNQLPAKMVEEKKYPIPLQNPGDKAWAAKYGIDGRFGLELEALVQDGSYAPLRQVVAEVLNKELDVQRLYDLAREDSQFEAKIDAVHQIIDSVSERLRNYADLLFQNGFDDRENFQKDHAFKEAVIGSGEVQMDSAELALKIEKELRKAISAGKIDIKITEDGSGERE